MTDPVTAPMPPCIWCGVELKQPDAQICAGCKLWQERRRCGVCAQPIPRDATHCTVCKMVQTTVYKYCKVCQARMPEPADRCNVCTSFQDWRRHLAYSHTTLLLLVLLATSLAPVPAVSSVLNRHSDTSFVVTGATRDVIVLNVANTGRSASVLQRFELDFGKLPLEPVELRVIPEDQAAGKTYVAPGWSMVRLQTTGITQRGGVTKEQIRALLNAGAEVALTVSIKESDDRATGPWTKVPASVPASLVRNFILEGIPDD